MICASSSSSLQVTSCLLGSRIVSTNIVIFYSCVPKEGLTVTVTASKLPGLLRRGKISQSATKPCAVCFSNQKIGFGASRTPRLIIVLFKCLRTREVIRESEGFGQLLYIALESFREGMLTFFF